MPKLDVGLSLEGPALNLQLQFTVARSLISNGRFLLLKQVAFPWGGVCYGIMMLWDSLMPTFSRANIN